jgi:hypothetical protein
MEVWRSRGWEGKGGGRGMKKMWGKSKKVIR